MLVSVATLRDRLMCRAGMAVPRAAGMRGVTLAELLVTIAILGIVATVALPSIASFVAGQRTKTTAYDLFAAFMLARSEAVKRNADVVIGAATANTSWTGGWTITVGSTTIATQPAINAITITGTSSALTYRYNGRTTATAAQTFQVTGTGAGSVDSRRCVTIGTNGQPVTKLGACS